MALAVSNAFDQTSQTTIHKRLTLGRVMRQRLKNALLPEHLDEFREALIEFSYQSISGLAPFFLIFIIGSVFLSNISIPAMIHDQMKSGELFILCFSYFGATLYVVNKKYKDRIDDMNIRTLSKRVPWLHFISPINTIVLIFAIVAFIFLRLHPELWKPAINSTAIVWGSVIIYIISGCILIHCIYWKNVFDSPVSASVENNRQNTTEFSDNFGNRVGR